MKRELNLDDFIRFLESLEYDKPKKLYTENFVEKDVASYNFQRLNFNGNDIILYENPYCSDGIIQDIPVAPWQDLAADVFEMFEGEGEYKVFIEE